MSTYPLFLIWQWSEGGRESSGTTMYAFGRGSSQSTSSTYSATLSKPNRRKESRWMP